MIYFLKGKIALIENDSVVIDVNGVGYQALVSHLDGYQVGEEVLMYTYNVVREDENYLIGFKDIEEKNVFLSLIKVKGLGPKTVINALSATTPNDVINAIGLGAKAAGQIILDLKGELTGSKGNPKQYEEVYDALKSLGFKGAAIDRVLATINEPNATTEDILRIALSRLKK